MATHSSILAWKILWTKEPGGLLHRVAKSQTQLKQLSMHKRTHAGLSFRRRPVPLGKEEIHVLG